MHDARLRRMVTDNDVRRAQLILCVDADHKIGEDVETKIGVLRSRLVEYALRGVGAVNFGDGFNGHELAHLVGDGPAAYWKI